MEQLLHYVWKHRIFPLKELKTTDGESIEVISPGIHNSNEGPDFLNAKVRIGDSMWAGSIEIHLKASDWHRHSHSANAKYDNVILHVVGVDDCCISRASGHAVPQMVLEVPERVRSNYEVLLREDRYPRCHKIIGGLPRLTVDSWLTALQTERFEQKAMRIGHILQQTNGNWEQTFFRILARAFGFGINSHAFETWAEHIDLTQTGHHRDELFQIETMFIGQAGLLERKPPVNDDYYERMKGEYAYLAHKFTLTPMDTGEWNFMRLRPQNSPYIRLSQLAQLYFDNRLNLSRIVEAKDIDTLRQLLATHATKYWRTHYSFGAESRESDKQLSVAMTDSLLINAVAPTLFCYGRTTMNEECEERALDLMEQIKAEDNHIIRMWRECGLTVASAADSQALIQLKNEYCDKRECLRCRFGYEYIKQNHGIEPKI